MAEIPPSLIPALDRKPASVSPAILLSLDPDFTLTMSTSSLLGSRAKLQDIPKVEQLILGRIRGWISDNLVWPKVRVLRLPGLGKPGNVEGDDGEGEYVWIEGVPVRRPADGLDSANRTGSTEDGSTVASSPVRGTSPARRTSVDSDEGVMDRSLPGFGELGAFASTPVGSSRKPRASDAHHEPGSFSRPRKPSFGAHLGQGASAPRAAHPRESFEDGGGPGDRMWRSMFSPGPSTVENNTTQWALSGGMASLGLGRTNSGSGTPFHLRDRLRAAHGRRVDGEMQPPSR